MPKSGIYSITNTVDGKRYIGRSVDLQKRKQMHFWKLHRGEHFNLHLQRAFNINPNAFIFEVIEYCPPEMCNDREAYWIAYFGTTDMEKGYNICTGGEASTGRPCTKEMKEKISEKNTGRQYDEAVIRKRVETKKKHMETDPEFAERVRLSYKASGKRLGGWNAGMKASEETRAKLSASHRGRKVTENHKERLRALYSGEKSLTAKLTEDDVIDIRMRALNGERQRDILRDYPKVTPQTIYDIVRNRRWHSIPNTREELQKLYEQRRNESGNRQSADAVD